MKRREHFQKKAVCSIRTWMDRTPLWLELSFALTGILLLLMLALALTTYRRSRNVIIRDESDTSVRLLSLKMKNLEQYLDELSAFSIQAVYDNSLYAVLQSRGELTTADRSSISAAVRASYHTRKDLNSYMLYLPEQGLAVGYSLGARVGSERVRITDSRSIQETPMYRLCMESPRHLAILPSGDDASLFNFSHSILRVKEGSASAIVSFDVNLQSLETLTDYGSREEYIALFDPQGTLLYTDMEDPALLSEEIFSTFAPAQNSSPDAAAFLDTSSPVPAGASAPSQVTGDGEPVFAELGGIQYLLTETSGSRYGMRLVSLVPVGALTSRIREASLSALRQQIVWLLLSVLAIYAFVRWLTNPLTVLTAGQKQAGTGDFTPIDIGRSREIRELSMSFNEMTSHIDAVV